MRILIVEDEPRMLELLRKGLYEQDFTVMTAPDAETGMELALAHQFDVIVLDVGLPRMNGYELLQALRAQNCSTPVLMLTARDTEDDIIRGLDLGADDYLTKPFSFPELVARLQAITKRSGAIRDAGMTAGDLTIDPLQHTAVRSGKSIDLTRLEYLLLTTLTRHAGACVSRHDLVQAVWGADNHVGPTALDVLVNSLRAKIDEPFNDKLISTVRGSGYLFTISGSAEDSAQ